MATTEQISPPSQQKDSPQSHNGRWAGFAQLLAARMRELKREPEVLFWVFAFPLLLALGLGIAFRNKPADTTSVVIVSGPDAQSTLDMLKSSPQHASIRAEIADEPQALKSFRLGKYDLVITAKSKENFEYRYDPARPESVLSRTQINDALQSSAGRRDSIPTNSVTSSEPGSRYIDFLIPGLLGMNLMNAGMWGVGFALVDMRQRKLLKRFVATPMRRTDFLMAIATSRIMMMIIEVVLMLTFGILLFHMLVLGSWAAVLFWGLLGSFTFGSLGLLTASRAQKLETISGLINLVMMPMWIFSGVFFSYERFPAAVQPLIRLLPLTALNDALRATILEGTPLIAQSGRLLVLLVWGGVSFILAVRWFRWT
ncbi:MAG TPA: ABC transporter permease [Terriglobales bacterium]